MAKKRIPKRNPLDTYDFKIFQKEIKKQLSNNVTVNVVMSPLYFILICAILVTEYNMPIIAKVESFSFTFSVIATIIKGSAITYSILSTIVYLYASHFYQPDLDVYSNRPGMGHFPLGKTIGIFRIGRFLKWVCYPINRIWYHLWTPFARLFTHRGVTHIPIISTILRALYLYFWFFLLKSIILLVMDVPAPLLFVESWLKNFFLKGDFFSFMLLNFPIYISDVAHIAVDYWDSVKRGISFCPPKLPKGIMYQIYLILIKGGKDL